MRIAPYPLENALHSQIPSWFALALDLNLNFECENQKRKLDMGKGSRSDSGARRDARVFLEDENTVKPKDRRSRSQNSENDEFIAEKQGIEERSKEKVVKKKKSKLEESSEFDDERGSEASNKNGEAPKDNSKKKRVSKPKKEAK